jgi:putative transposase
VGEAKRNPPIKPENKYMSDYHRALLKGGTYFFTVVTYKRWPIFKKEANIDLLEHCFQTTIATNPFKIDAFVILPDHLHTIWTLPDNDSDFSIRWKLIKANFSRHYNGSKAEDISDSMLNKNEKGIWQRRFWEHAIRDEKDFDLHCNYIHYNPVKHGLASSPIEWRHSSFRNFLKTGSYPSNWGSQLDKRLMELNLE